MGVGDRVGQEPPAGRIVRSLCVICIGFWVFHSERYLNPATGAIALCSPVPPTPGVISIPPTHCRRGAYR